MKRKSIEKIFWVIVSVIVIFTMVVWTIGPLAS